MSKKKSEKSPKKNQKNRERAASFAHECGATARANERSLMMSTDDRSDIAGAYGFTDWAAMSSELQKEARTKFKEGWFAEKAIEKSGWQLGDD